MSSPLLLASVWSSLKISCWPDTGSSKSRADGGCTYFDFSRMSVAAMVIFSFMAIPSLVTLPVIRLSLPLHITHALDRGSLLSPRCFGLLSGSLCCFWRPIFSLVVARHVFALGATKVMPFIHETSCACVLTASDCFGSFPALCSHIRTSDKRVHAYT